MNKHTDKHGSFFSFVEELFVEEEDEQVDVNFCFVKHLHHRHAFILELEQVLVWMDGWID